MTAENAEIAVRSHDVLVTSGISRAAEFESLINLGAAVRLAINLRGMPPVNYPLLREVAVHRLGLQPSEVKPALDLLAEAEMVSLYTKGKTIRTVLPDIPFFSNLTSIRPGCRMEKSRDVKSFRPSPAFAPAAEPEDGVQAVGGESVRQSLVDLR